MTAKVPRSRIVEWIGMSLVLSFLTLPEAAAAEPSAEAMILAGLRTPSVAVEGRLSFGAEDERSRKMRLWLAPDGRFRRDLLGVRGDITASISSDGQSTWYYDRRRRAAWRGEVERAPSLLPTQQLEALLKTHGIADVGQGRVAARLCRIVDIRSDQGQPMRRLWMDLETGVILQAYQFGPDGARKSWMRFSSVEFPKKIEPAVFIYQVPPGTTIIGSRQRPNFLGIEAIARLGRMKPILPVWVPRGFILNEVDNVEIQAAHVLHARYTDGLEALSIFQIPEKVVVDEETVRPPSGAHVLRVRRGSRKYLIVGRLSDEDLRRMAQSIP